ncbi:MAG: PQQ-binding-like beta-propeller repeat protein [Candidatus Parvarchaeum sp.]
MSNVYNIYIYNYNNSNSIYPTISKLVAKPFAYQFEDSSSHFYFINSSISNFNISISGLGSTNPSVLGPVSYYKNELLIPLSSESMSINFSQYWGGLAAVNGTNGNIIWIDYFNNQVMTEPIVFNGVAYIGLGSAFYNSNINSNGVIAVNSTNGRLIWTRYLDSEHMPTFVYYNDTLVVAPGLGKPISNSSGILYFLNATNGRTIIKINTSSESAMSSILVVNGTGYFGAAAFNFSSGSPSYQENFKNKFYAISLRKMSVLWVDKFNSSFGMQDSSPVFSNGQIITGYSSGLFNNTISILGLNYSTGDLDWNFTTPERGNISSPYIQLPPLTSYNGVVYSDSPTIGVLYALNASNGTLLWQFYTGPTSANVNIINNSIVLLNSAGELYVINTYGKLINKRYVGIAAGPENVIQIGNSVVLYGASNNIEVVPTNFLFS